ncbi:Cyanidin 3-O-glucoside 7-O-glucosyltransferase (acyl-glucose) [Frankliniella fusca]|uniref:Cyanidin 3-O-glucoside 7-O-glucosyltransferase (Acyl-glucose) n=1 Tax=Frankliniella fusca TaxID=407009 RepID=A0AAE1LUS6_9NEOP|nr:Cyanidin 3-O-glucoside 7-O-glucosyltransferase (acyl-glucose) [Frankliniella fusca]
MLSRGRFILLICAVLGPFKNVTSLVLEPSDQRSRTQPTLNFEADEYVDLPDGFLLGAGTSAMQVEGAWNADGKSESVMDYFLHLDLNGTYAAMKPPDVAANSYERYKEDVAAAAALKLQVYRFSVSWPRVLPKGDTSEINQAGVDYYNNLINEIISHNIQPMITMNHFDFPLVTMKKTGGWADERIVKAFTEYADFLFKTFGDRVQLWTTINEPNYYCMNFALFDIPGVYKRQPGDDYKCVHHTILAHMETYRLYEQKYKATQKGKIGAAALTLWCRPNSTSYEDIQAAERANLFALGSIYNPVVYGDYPAALKDRVEYYSRKEGLTESRLPKFTEEQKLRLKGSADFLCFNAYMGTTVADGTRAPHPDIGTMESDRDAIEVGSNTQPGFFGDLFMRANPWVLREAPLWIRDNYPGVPLFITENGWGDERVGADPLDDWPRVGYHSQYLQQLIRVAKEDGVKVMGYLVWSLIDTYEWTSNYNRKFGLVHVDYEGGSLNRTLKKSASFFQEIGTRKRVPKVPFTFVPGSGSERILVHPSLSVLFVIILSWFH